jgi:hypothetical protein
VPNPRSRLLFCPVTDLREEVEVAKEAGEQKEQEKENAQRAPGAAAAACLLPSHSLAHQFEFELAR